VKNRLIAVGRGHERAAHRCSARVSVEIFLNEFGYSLEFCARVRLCGPERFGWMGALRARRK